VAAFQRQALHARRLAFSHPLLGRDVDFEQDAPSDMQTLLQALKDDCRH